MPTLGTLEEKEKGVRPGDVEPKSVNLNSLGKKRQLKVVRLCSRLPGVVVDASSLYL